ncbi:acetyl-CoA carboxylase biotin carboxyl carrier protein subunit [bacterium]|nr:acetyl-CoA carboxylase biotin carboxyl carrier protein subunit [bacterium]
MKEILCPMPGKIIEITVQLGSQVVNDTQVMIHEAMKMENSIVAGCEGTVREILVGQGDVVETDQVLITLD